MKHPLETFAILALCVSAALPAQNDGKAKPDPKAKAATTHTKPTREQEKKDRVMAKDPAILAIDKFLARNKVDTSAPDWRTKLKAPPLAPFEPKNDYFWHLETSKGHLVVQLFPDTAPMHTTCGIYLARLGYYDGLKFHRIIKGFMAQGGCPLGTGSGGPGYTIDGEFFGTRKHDKPGILSTANTGQPKTDGSQFFLTFVPTPHLDGRHTIWGEVVEGMDTLKALEAAGSAGDTRLAEPPVIVSSWIRVAAAGASDKAGAAGAAETDEAKKADVPAPGDAKGE